MNELGSFRFESPAYLALLAVLPLLVVMSLRSLAGLGPLRRILAIGARCLVVMLMVAALAGMQRMWPVRDLSVIFLLDRSRSVPAELQRSAFQYVARAEAGRPPSDRVGVVSFDGVSDIEQAPMRSLEVSGVTARGEPDQTNIAAAVRLALALLPADTLGRVVLLTDGNENVGAVMEEAQQYAAAGIPIDVVPLPYEYADEVMFEQLKAPATASAEETVNLQAVLRSQKACAGKILLRHNGSLVDLNGAEPGGGYSVELEAGPNRFSIPVPLRSAGAHRFEADFVPDEEQADTISENNIGRAFTVVSGQGRVLVLASAASLESDPSAVMLKRALERERLDCDVEAAGSSAIDQARLLEYAMVVLADVPASDFTDSEKQTLAAYVRELGGGLAMIGGEDAFGAGGWLGSPVEEVMPVSFDVQHRKEFRKGALVLVMHACEVPDGNSLGIACAKNAVIALSSRDLVGVLAWNWEGAKGGNWTVPLQEVGARRPIINAIDRMSMGDLPDLDEVMRPGVQALLARTDAGPKHMIVVSDFDPSAPRSDLLKTMADNGITCTTIAIGYGGHPIDENSAATIAQATGGRFYATRDHRQLPRIFIKESREVRRSLVQEGQFTPAVSDVLSPLVPGLTSEALPNLGGFVLTTAKPAATLAMARHSTDGDDPILAHWQVGLGKAVAFTSGLWTRWGADWAAWPKFDKFWAQVARWASRPPGGNALSVSTSVQGGRARVQVETVGADAQADGLIDVHGTVVNPAQEAEPLRLTQTGPGRYEGEFEVGPQGNYIINLGYDLGAGGGTGQMRTGVTVSHSPEFGQLRANLPLLQDLHTRTAGRALELDDPTVAFDRAGLREASARRSIWETLVRWVLVMFLVDVAVRRIAVDPAAVRRKLRQFIADMAGRGRPAEAAEVLTTLKGKREQVREERARAAAPAAPSEPAPGRPSEAPARRAGQEDLERALDGAKGTEKPVVAPPSGPKPGPSEADYTARLLKAKRRALEDQKRESGDESPPPSAS